MFVSSAIPPASIDVMMGSGLIAGDMVGIGSSACSLDDSDKPSRCDSLAGFTRMGMLWDVRNPQGYLPRSRGRTGPIPGSGATDDAPNEVGQEASSVSGLAKSASEERVQRIKPLTSWHRTPIAHQPSIRHTAGMYHDGSSRNSLKYRFPEDVDVSLRLGKLLAQLIDCRIGVSLLGSATLLGLGQGPSWPG
jgi:hypothetical protein